MSKIIFRIQPTAKTITQLIKGVRGEGSRRWAGRAMARAPLIRADIGAMLVRKFNNTVVARSLRGQGSEDLPAHFGLDNSSANALVDGMAELIRTSVRTLSQSTCGAVSLRIQAVENNWSNYLSLPGAQYMSRPSNILIPVVKWLLIDPTIDFGQAA